MGEGGVAGVVAKGVVVPTPIERLSGVVHDGLG